MAEPSCPSQMSISAIKSSKTRHDFQPQQLTHHTLKFNQTSKMAQTITIILSYSRLSIVSFMENSLIKTIPFPAIVTIIVKYFFNPLQGPVSKKNITLHHPNCCTFYPYFARDSGRGLFHHDRGCGTWMKKQLDPAKHGDSKTMAISAHSFWYYMDMLVSNDTQRKLPTTKVPFKKKTNGFDTVPSHSRNSTMKLPSPKLPTFLWIDLWIWTDLSISIDPSAMWSVVENFGCLSEHWKKRHRSTKILSCFKCLR